MRIFLLIITMILMATFSCAESAPSQIKIPQVNSNEHAQYAVNNQNPANKETKPASPDATTPNFQPITQESNLHPQPVREQSKDQGHKWYSDFSIDLTFRFTDILLVAFTAALAVYTCRLNRSTEKLWNAGEKQMQITRDSLELARQEFNAAHRPKIIIHTFERNRETDKKIGASFTYVNVGTTPAKIIEIETIIFFSNQLASNDSIVTERFDSKLLEPGEGSTYSAKSNISDMIAIIDGMRASRGKSSREIICIGRIKYIDMQGTARETGFYRVFNTDQYCWQRDDNSDYEYSY